MTRRALVTFVLDISLSIYRCIYPLLLNVILPCKVTFFLQFLLSIAIVEHQNGVKNRFHYTSNISLQNLLDQKSRKSITDKHDEHAKSCIDRE